jgi:threonylcarbamoyladenosine tRNA methylthiotransferase MtaB
VALVLANAHKERVLESILALEGQTDLSAGDGCCLGIGRERLPLGHTRALIKIQDGCDNRCAYCIVSRARGPQRSRRPEDVLAEIKARCAEGYQEAVLTGVNIGAYGHDSAAEGPLPPQMGWSLARLVQVILEETPLPRVRLSSVEPWDLPSEMLDLWVNPRLCRHLHLPLQSGCDETLKRMNRRTTTAAFGRLVAAVRQRVPEIGLTTDIIVGYPGETDSEFAATLAFVESVQFTRLHVFRYSRREHTRAAILPEQVPAPVAQERSAVLVAVGKRLALQYHRRFVGREVVVLLESARQEGGVVLWSGLSDNYLRVTVPAVGDLANTFVRVVCTMADETGLSGELLP